MALNHQTISQSLAKCRLAELAQDPVAAGVISEITILSDSPDPSNSAQVRVDMMVGFPCDRAKSSIEQRVAEHLASDLGIIAEVNVAWQVAASSSGTKAAPIAEVKNIIAIASGKGGVGKSTTTANLALALSAEGARVGILDADIYGPSQPIMLGAPSERPETRDQKRILPVERYGIQSMSIGYLVDPEQAMVWRGPMASGALQQLLNDTQWQGLDYLLVDLPPGTGDVQLTLSQKVPVTAAVIVTTPQDIALADAIKAVAMFNKVSVPVLGVVENMAMHICSKCGHQEAIFGEGGGAKLALEHDTELLGSLPLAKAIRDDADSGKPSVVASPDSQIAITYGEVARKIAAKLAHPTVPSVADFPEIIIKDD